MNLSVLTSIGLGAFHALEPGHGKTFLIGFIGGNAIPLRNLLKFVLWMVFTHSFTLLLFAFLIPFLLPQLSHSIHSILPLLAGLLVTAIGFSMLWRLRPSAKHKECSVCKDLYHNHGTVSGVSSRVAPNKSFKFTPKAEPSSFVLAPPLSHEHTSSPEYTRIFSWAALASGLLPCPSALAVVGLSLTQGRLSISLLMLLAYVMGFTAVMFGIVLSTYYFKKLSLGLISEKWLNRLPLVCALMILLSGAYYVILGINHLHHGH